MGPARWGWALVLMAHTVLATYLRCRHMRTLVAYMFMSFNLAPEAAPATLLHQYGASFVKP